MNNESEGRVFARWPRTSARLTSPQPHGTNSPYHPWQGSIEMPDTVTNWVAAHQAAKLIRWLRAQQPDGFRDAYYDPSTRRVVVIWSSSDPTSSTRVKQIAARDFFVAVDDVVPATSDTPKRQAPAA